MAKAFREKGVDYEKVNYFIDPLDEKKLRSLLKKADLRPIDVVRKRDRVYKENGLSEVTPDGTLIKLIIENPSLLERPIVEVGDKAVLARPIERALELIE